MADQQQKEPVRTRAEGIQSAREEQARREVGETSISSAGAWVLVVFFLLLIAAVPAWQSWFEIRADRASGEPAPRPAALKLEPLASAWQEGWQAASSAVWWRRTAEANRLLLTAMARYEDALEDDSRLGAWVRPWMQSVLLMLGAGSEEVFPGREGWLFYAPGVKAVTGPGFLQERNLRNRRFSVDEQGLPVEPDPRVGILDFHQQLAARGIVLVVVPTPVKPSIYPGLLASGVKPPVHNADHQELMRFLQRSGVRVYDPTEDLLRYRAQGGRAFLRTDTHWTPTGMQTVAAGLANYLQAEALVPEAREDRFQAAAAEEVVATGDVAAMLELIDSRAVRFRESTEVIPVMDLDGQYWRADSDAPVLVLGDSFSNIFSLQTMGWGESAGFVEHLSLALGLPLDRITRNDAGALATREQLGRELARGNDRLADKQVVVWQFANRELVLGNWRPVSLRLGQVVAGDRLALAAGETRRVRAQVASVSAVPRPGTVPYADHVMSAHLVDLEALDGKPIDAQEAVIYARSMTANAWQPPARWRVGDTVEVTLRPWEEVEASYDRLNRSELPDPELQFELPVWAE